MRQALRAASIFALLVAVFLVSRLGGFVPADQALTGWRFAAADRAPSGEVVFVEIDARSLAEIGVWPWPRSVHGALLDTLMDAGASDVVFDVDFGAASTEAQDAAFEGALDRAGGYAYIAAFRQLSGGQIVWSYPLARFAQFAMPVLVNVEADRGGQLRTVPAALPFDRQTIPSIALALGQPATAPPATIHLDFSIDLGQIERISAIDVLNGKAGEAVLAGKQVVIGASALELRDFFAVPRFGIVPGPMAQIAAAETLKAGRSLIRLGLYPAAMFAMLLAALALWQGARLSLLQHVVVALALAVCTEAVALLMLREWAMTMSSVPIHAALASLVGVAVLDERAERWRQHQKVRADKRRQAEQLQYLASHDALTGALSRYALEERINAQLETGGALTAVLVRIDRLRNISATLGHAVADSVMCEAHHRLELLSGDLVGRLGSDVFALNWPGVSSAAELRSRLDRIRQALEAPYQLDDHTVVLGVRFGVSSTGTAQGDAPELLQQAEIALRTSAIANTGNIAIFANADGENMRARQRLDIAMRRALQAREFFLVYQPQIDLETGAMIGVEALVRWRHPELGLISPADFISLAEETGLIIALGDWVLRQACREAAGWAWGGRLSVNVSAIQFKLADMVALVEQATRESGFPVHRLDLEITESLYVGNDIDIVGALERLQGMGVKIAIDDFGTGYSSLSYLSRLPADKIKIDQSFVRSLPNSGSETIIETIVTMAKRLKLEVIAEGVETAAQRDYLRSLGCDTGQGYLFSRPASAGQLGLTRLAIAV